jgi:TrmH family RNA methyltransferase
MTDITSAQNDRIKLVRALQTQAKARRRHNQIVLEGMRLINDALNCGALPDFVLYLKEQTTLDRPAFKVFRHLSDLGVPLFAVTDAILNSVTDLETSPGMLAVFPQPELPVPESPSLVVVLDQMSTPGNLGSALRTATAAGADLVVLTPNSVDPSNPKVLRGGMGAHFRVPIQQMAWDDLALQYGQLHTYVAVADGEHPYYAVDWLRPSMVIVGGEAHGPSDNAFAVAGTTISIPMERQTESLNAAVSAGIILYEIKRQRILSAQKGAKS